MPRKIQEWREKVRLKGIDQYAIEMDNTVLFKSFRAINDRIQNDRVNTLIVSYAQLAQFDDLVNRTAAFCRFPGGTDSLEGAGAAAGGKAIRPTAWIGQRWVSDATPGRYRNELKPETIAKLDDQYREILQLRTAPSNCLTCVISWQPTANEKAWTRSWSGGMMSFSPRERRDWSGNRPSAAAARRSVPHRRGAWHPSSVRRGRRRFSLWPRDHSQ